MIRFSRIFLLCLLVLTGLYFGGIYVYENRLYAPVSDRVSDETKHDHRVPTDGRRFAARAPLEPTLYCWLAQGGG